jgi:hypothetical protein
MALLLRRLSLLVVVAASFAPAAKAQIYWNPVNGHSYALTPFPQTIAGARSVAAAMGGTLVTINDAAEQSFLSTIYYGTLAAGTKLFFFLPPPPPPVVVIVGVSFHAGINGEEDAEP